MVNQILLFFNNLFSTELHISSQIAICLRVEWIAARPINPVVIE